MIRVRDLVKAFGDKVVLDGISLDLEQGQILAVMGTSGGGKTTLLKCISGLIKPNSGTIEVAGIDVLKEPDAARHKMGLVFQSAALFDYLSVRDNVLFGPRRWFDLNSKEEDELLEEALEAVGLAGHGHLLPSELSGGMKKRVGLARAIALRPQVLLYDEPVTGLDPVTAYTIDALVVDVRKRYGVTSIVVSHDLSSVFRIADRIAFLEAGKLAFMGTAEGFRESRHQAIQELIEKSEAQVLSP